MEFDLQKLDEEDKEFYEHFKKPFGTVQEPLELERLLGFRTRGARCFVPSAECGVTAAPLMSMIPIYETIFVPISPFYWSAKDEVSRIRDNSTFKRQHQLTVGDVATLAEKGRVIPYFAYPYRNYDKKTVSPLFQPGIPRISHATMILIRGAAMNRAVIDEPEKLGGLFELAEKDVDRFDFARSLKSEQKQMCAICLSTSYMLGLREKFSKSEFKLAHACFVSYALTTEILDSVLQTRCRIAKEVLSNFVSTHLPEDAKLEYILKGLKVSYSPEIPLEEYIDVFDGKTSRALRKITQDLLSDPMSGKYSDKLNAKIYDLNQRVEELAASRMAKVFQAASDMAVYGGKQFIESQTQRFVKIPKEGLIKLGEWLASKGVDLAAKMQRKDWSIAQLYRARCKLERCK